MTLLASAGLVSMLIGCTSQFRSQDSAPLVSPSALKDLPDPEVIYEPRSRWGNSAYKVFGRKFEILETAEGYDFIGEASWYGTKFHDRLTANGERYDMHKLTAAHPTLPLPTFARVTNLENGRHTILRINDRGPFHGGRFIDISYAAAAKLGMIEKGTARVRVTAVTANSREKEVTSTEFRPAIQTSSARYFLQAGAFVESKTADELTKTLETILNKDVFVVRIVDDELYRVRVGPFMTRRDAERFQALMLARHNSVSLIIEE
jgi:rare lipoprotein A